MSHLAPAEERKNAYFGLEGHLMKNAPFHFLGLDFVESATKTPSHVRNPVGFDSATS
jgi:hypothetical protein